MYSLEKFLERPRKTPIFTVGYGVRFRSLHTFDSIREMILKYSRNEKIVCSSLVHDGNEYHLIVVYLENLRMKELDSCKTLCLSENSKFFLDQFGEFSEFWMFKKSGTELVTYVADIHIVQNPGKIISWNGLQKICA